MTARLLRLKDVITATGLSRSTIYAREKEGIFPKRVPLGNGLTAWVESEVQAWIAERITARDGERKAA